MNLKSLVVSNFYKIYGKYYGGNFYSKAGDRISYIKLNGKQVDTKRRLIVSFSGFAGRYQKGRYNYIRSLSKSNSERIFLLDNFGFKGVGSYYLGNQCMLYKNKAIPELINSVSSPYIDETVFIGTSKGGSAALIYGILMNVNKIIIGSPQYRIGDYLLENDYHKLILNEIIDIENGYDVSWLNNIIDYLLDQKVYTGEITLIYSTIEKSYEWHTKPLIDAIKKHNIHLILFDEKFENHNDVGRYFNKYLASL